MYVCGWEAFSNRQPYSRVFYKNVCTTTLYGKALFKRIEKKYTLFVSFSLLVVGECLIWLADDCVDCRERKMSLKNKRLCY